MYISLIKTTPITICYFLILINKTAASRSYLKEVLECFFYIHTPKKKITNKNYGNLFNDEEDQNINVWVFNTC